MSEEITPPRSRRMFDTQINLQGLCIFLAGVVASFVYQWFTLVGDVREVKTEVRNNKVEWDARASRIEREQQQLRIDGKDQVRSVQDQVTGVAGDVKEILRYLRDSSPTKRPELGRWVK